MAIAIISNVCDLMFDICIGLGPSPAYLCGKIGRSHSCIGYITQYFSRWLFVQTYGCSFLLLLLFVCYLRSYRVDDFMNSKGGGIFGATFRNFIGLVVRVQMPLLICVILSG